MARVKRGITQFYLPPKSIPYRFAYLCSQRTNVFKEPSGERIGIRLIVKTVFDKILRISDSEAGMKEKKSGGVVGEDGER